MSYLGALLAQAHSGTPQLRPVLPARFEPDGPIEVATEVEPPAERATHQDASVPPGRPVPEASTVPPSDGPPHQLSPPGMPTTVDGQSDATVPPGSRVVLDPPPGATQDEPVPPPRPRSQDGRVAAVHGAEHRPARLLDVPTPIEPKPLIATSNRDYGKPSRLPDSEVASHAPSRTPVAAAPLRPALSGPELPTHSRLDEPTTVRVSIGRVEVRSPPPPTPPPAPAPWRPRLSLDDYLRERSR